MSGINRHLQMLRLDMHEQFAGERARVATTATDASDEVEVTLPNSEAPSLRIPVQWRLGVKVVGGNLQPRYPQRGDTGIVIYDDEGEAWLIY